MLNRWLKSNIKAVLLAVGGLMVLLFTYLGIKKMVENQGSRIKPKGTAKEGLEKVSKRYGVEFARDIERAVRLETSHFKSGQWLRTGSAGMEATEKEFPFGWGSLKKFATARGLNANDFFTVEMNDTKKPGMERFIGWRETGTFIEYMAWFIQTVRGGYIGFWNSLNQDKAAKYMATIKHIDAKFV